MCRVPLGNEPFPHVSPCPAARSPLPRLIYPNWLSGRGRAAGFPPLLKTSASVSKFFIVFCSFRELMSAV